jgi:hypothetical protein
MKKLLVVCLGLLLVAGSRLLPASRSPRRPQTVRWIAFQHAWINAIKPFLPEFEAETGIKLQFEAIRTSSRARSSRSVRRGIADPRRVRHPAARDMLQFEERVAGTARLSPMPTSPSASRTSPACTWTPAASGQAGRHPDPCGVAFLYYNRRCSPPKAQVPTTLEELWAAAI